MADQPTVTVRARTPVTPPTEEKPSVIAEGGGASGTPSEVAPRVVEVTKEAPKSQMVKVFPLLTINQMRIGENNFQFVAGRAREVPREILQVLVEKKIIAPSIELA